MYDEVDPEILDEISAEIEFYEGRKPLPGEVESIVRAQNTLLTFWFVSQGQE